MVPIRVPWSWWDAGTSKAQIAAFLGALSGSFRRCALLLTGNAGEVMSKVAYIQSVNRPVEEFIVGLPTHEIMGGNLEDYDAWKKMADVARCCLRQPYVSRRVMCLDLEYDLLPYLNGQTTLNFDKLWDGLCLFRAVIGDVDVAFYPANYMGTLSAYVLRMIAVQVQARCVFGDHLRVVSQRSANEEQYLYNQYSHLYASIEGNLSSLRQIEQIFVTRWPTVSLLKDVLMDTTQEAWLYVDAPPTVEHAQLMCSLVS